MRVGMMAEQLVRRGHQVVWWSTTFDHSRKTYRFSKDTVEVLPNGCEMRFLHSISYRSNVSLRRIWNHICVARKFAEQGRQLPAPDVIFCGLPTPELSLQSVRYGHEKSVPVVLDVRDLWPDDIILLAPTALRGLARLCLWPMTRTVRRACHGATAICATSPVFVKWGLACGNRRPSPLDRDFPLAYAAETPAPESVANAEAYWRQFNLLPGKDEFIVCYFGMLGQNSELLPVLEAARQLDRGPRKIRFILCGNGDRLEQYQNAAQGCANVLFPGWVGRAEIWTLMRMAKVGLVPIQSIYSYMSNLPNKTIEYMSAGLPLVSCLQGVLQQTLAEHNIGLTYQNGNADELLSILCRLYDSPQLVHTMSRNAMALFNQRFHAEKVYNEMSDYLEEVAKLGSAARAIHRSVLVQSPAV